MPDPKDDKATKLAKDIKAGFVLEKPKCKKCGWEGASPAVAGAGCPQCAERIE